ncbi:unnamed protein product, partial [Rotaria magnacalcarata]
MFHREEHHELTI